MIYDHAYIRAEFDWLASDEDGLVAYLSSAGAGPLPKEAVEAADQLEDLLSKVRELMLTGEARPTGGVLNPSDWMDVAARGFYAYDWSLANRHYEMIAEPSHPIHLREISNPELRRLATRIRLPVRLSEARHIAG